MNSELQLTDFRKWLIYSFDNQGFDNYYNLHKALETETSYKTIRLVRNDTDDRKSYLLSVDSVREQLVITDEQRGQFMRYLTDNYFQTNDLGALAAEKSRGAQEDKSHAFIGGDKKYPTDLSNFKVKQHPKETAYYNIKLVFSVFIYLAFIAWVIYSASSWSSALGLLLLLPLILVFMFFNKLIHGIFVGIIKGNSTQVTKDQFPEIYSIVEAQASKLKIKVPEIFITYGHFNSFVTKYSRGHILMIYSEVAETTLHGNYDVLSYITAHELCHIKQKHLSKEKYLFPSRIIPLLGLAYSRGCEYTCDRVGYHFSPKGSIEGILIMTTGKEIYTKLNIEKHIENAKENEGFWTWLSEKLLTHPHLYKRLIQIKKYSQFN
ncbi:MAG: M48 family metallopeptidase [Bacteroidetes bacterium]|nr:M48 family metallopeptidase [Bacteroidota bacterium]